VQRAFTSHPFTIGCPLWRFGQMNLERISVQGHCSADRGRQKATVGDPVRSMWGEPLKSRQTVVCEGPDSDGSRVQSCAGSGA
jgi:hypothetical protein